MAKKKQKPVDRAVFTAAPKSGYSDRDAAHIGPVLQDLINASGGNISKRLLYADVKARHGKKSPHPLDKYYEWDDAVAGDKYRLAQTGKMLRSIIVCYTHAESGEEEERGKVRAFYSVQRTTATEDAPPQMRHVYVGLPQVRDEAGLAAQVMAGIARNFREARDRYNAYAQVIPELAKYSGVVDAINKLLEQNEAA